MIQRAVILAALLFFPTAAHATGPACCGGGGSSISANSCSVPGDFATGIATDGTLTCSTPSGGGNVSNTGTPANNQIAVWTDATTIEGDPKLTLSGSSLTLGDSAVDAGFTLATGLTGGTDPQIDFTNGQVDCANCRFTLTGGTKVIPDAGGGGVATRVPYWSDTDTLTDEAAFAYDSSTNTLTVTNVTGNASTASTASDLSNAGIDAVLPDIDGFGLSINTGTTPDELQLAPGEVTGPQVWGDGSGTMSWTFNTGITDPIIDFYNTGVVDVTGTLEVGGVAVLLDGTGTVDGTNLASDSVTSGKVQDGSLTSGDHTESFISAYDGSGLEVDTATSPDTLKVATALDLGGNTSLEVPNGASPTTDAFGEIAGDNNAWASGRGAVQWFDGTANTFLVGALASDTPSNGQVPKYNTGGTITWESDSGGGAHDVTASSLGLHCDHSANDTATLRSALETGGAAAGKALFIPSGCKILLGTPGSGDSVADLASNTSIECEDSTAGFVLARLSCSSGSNTPGAACENDTQCTGGTCNPDYSGGGSFAPTNSDTYTLFGAASGATKVGLRRCSIWANGASKDYGYLGGTGKSWGYCDGSGPTDVLGQGCVTTCNSSSGALYGVACTADSDCGGNVGRACVENAGTCKTNGGLCTAAPYTTAWGPSGKGKINLVDFTNATDAAIEGVRVYDHRRGDFTIRTGTNSIVRDVVTNEETATAAQVDTWVNYALNPSVTTGMVAESGTYVGQSEAAGWDAAFEAKGWNTLVDTTADAMGASSESTWSGTAGLLISSAGVVSYGFRGESRLLNCVRPKFGLSSSGGYNFLVSNPYCDQQVAAKYIVQGAGNQYLGIRGAWAGVSAVLGLGDQRGRCASGSRSGKVCVFGAGDNAAYGCPTGATCAAHNDFPAEGATHAVIAGGGLLHSDISTATMIRATDSKRCMAGSGTLGGPCTTGSDCGTGGSCQALRYNQILIDGVNLYGGVTTGIDLSTSSVGVDSRPTYGGPSISDWTVSGVGFNGQTNGIKFPSLARYCVGGSNAGNSCTADSGCTSGGGLCKGPVENFSASGGMAGVTTPLTNWDESYGDVSALSGLTPADNQGKTLSLTAGEALTKGQTVTISTAASNTVLKALTSNPEKVVGVVMADTLNGYTAKVLTQGIGYCIAHAAAGVTRGDLLKPSTTTAGAVGTGTTSDPLIGVAVETASANGTFRCLIGATAGIQSNATVFPKFADDGFFSTPVGYAACSGTPTTLATITHTATSGRTIRLQGTVAHDVSGAATRVATVSIRRGGSNCSSGSPTTLVTSDTEMKSNENIASAIGVKDTGQSGSVTYRLCACADTGSNIEADNAMLSLTEY